MLKKYQNKRLKVKKKWIVSGTILANHGKKQNREERKKTRTINRQWKTFSLAVNCRRFLPFFVTLCLIKKRYKKGLKIVLNNGGGVKLWGWGVLHGWVNWWLRDVVSLSKMYMTFCSNSNSVPAIDVVKSITLDFFSSNFLFSIITQSVS
jgi:hypothetical protein